MPEFDIKGIGPKVEQDTDPGQETVSCTKTGVFQHRDMGRIVYLG